MKPTGKEKIEIGQRSTNESARAAAWHSGFEDLRSPNKALEPTIMSVTIPADAGLAPAMIAAQL